MWACQAASMMGDGLVPVALSFAVISVGGGAAEIGIVLGAQWVAMVVFVLAGGVVADRFPRRRVLPRSMAPSSRTAP
jgi:MFS family permease